VAWRRQTSLSLDRACILLSLVSVVISIADQISLDGPYVLLLLGAKESRTQPSGPAECLRD